MDGGSCYMAMIVLGSCSFACSVLLPTFGLGLVYLVMLSYYPAFVAFRSTLVTCLLSIFAISKFLF